MNNLSILLLEAANLLSEGAVKTSKKHKLDNYLKKYNYQGDKKSGIITVDGKKIEVDRNTKSKTATLSDGDVAGRTTSADISTDKDRIILDKNFEKLKNNKRRDALLYHEIGHIKYQNPNKSNENDHKHNEREKEKEKLSKYEKFGTHANKDEFEADAYASTKPNGNHLNRTMRELYKNLKKDIPNQIKSEVEASTINNERLVNNMKEKDLNTLLSNKYSKKDLSNKSIDEKRKEVKDMHKEFVSKVQSNYFNNIKDIKKAQNVIGSNDMKQRSKALKDKSINKNVYRESIEFLLDEAISLLDI